MKFLSPLELVHTPNIHTIEDICGFLGTSKEKSCKAVVYQKNTDNRYVVLFIRGDLDVNETKLTNFLGAKFIPQLLMRIAASTPDISGHTACRKI